MAQFSSSIHNFIQIDAHPALSHWLISELRTQQLYIHAAEDEDSSPRHFPPGERGRLFPLDWHRVTSAEVAFQARRAAAGSRISFVSRCDERALPVFIASA